MRLSDIEVIDAHHHLWAMSDYHVWIHADPPVESVIGDYEAIRRDYLPSDLLSDAASVKLIGSVHVQAEWDPTDPAGETQWLSEQAAAEGLPSAIVGYADLSADDVEHLLDKHQQFERFRGIRHMLNWDPRPERAFARSDQIMTDPRWRRGFAVLQSRGLTFDMQIWPHQMKQAKELLISFPDSRVAINHAGFPIDRDIHSLNEWTEGLRGLAEFPGVYIKLSGFGLLDHAWTVDSIRPLIYECISLFGVERCMFGSNFPVDKLYADYTSIYSAYSAVTDSFSSSERAELFAGTARRFYRINAPQPGPGT